VIFLKAIDRILWLAYGNDATGSKTREKIDIILQALANSGSMPRSRLMEQFGMDESDEGDVDSFNDMIKPLRGNPSTNSSFSHPPELCFLKSGDEYSLSRSAFDASLLKLRKDVVDFVDRSSGKQVQDHKVLDQMLWLAYANNGHTYGYRENARKVLKYLIENGETGKEELMQVTEYEYGDENDDQRFRGMMQYLRASWKDEEDAKNPLHTGSHGFLVRQEMRNGSAYYSISVSEFKSTMNVVADNIRSFIEEG
jgi:hypothetical protein